MKCPGQDMQYWTAGAIFDVECPKCHANVEFYKDDTNRKCSHCGHRFVNPKMDFGCATYCQFAEQCLGTLPEEFAGARDNLLKDKVAVEMKRYWQTDFKKIRLGITAARYAESIGKLAGANMAIVICAAYVADIGTPEFRTILEKAGAAARMIEEIGSVLMQVAGGNMESEEAKIVHDALTLRTAQQQVRENESILAKIQESLEPHLLTPWGKELVQEANWYL